MLDVRRVERLAREQKSERRRAEPIEATTTESDVTILHGDFRDVLPAAS